MKILHSCSAMGPSYGGPFQSVRRLAQAQAKSGLEVVVQMPWSEEAYAHRHLWEPVTTDITCKVLLPPLGYAPGYASGLLSKKADLLHTHGIWQHSSWSAIGWKRRTGKPHIASIRGMLEPWAWRHHAWKKRPVWALREKRNLESAALLHATSDLECQAIRSLGLEVPIALIPNGVDLPDYSATAEPVKADNDGQRVALFLSRLHPKKGLPLLLEAWANLRPQGWILQIAGPSEGNHHEEMQRMALALGLGNIVQFLGPVAGGVKHETFRNADLFILPTHSENFGIAVAEALSYGLPVITTHGAPWEILRTEGCGWWVPVSAESIGAAIHEATTLPPATLKGMGAKGPPMVANRFAWDAIESQFAACYRWLLGESPQPACVDLVK